MTAETPRTQTAEDVARDQIIRAARFAADYWIDHVPADMPVEQRVTGAIFTFLAELDGVGNLPPVDMVVLQSNEAGETVGETRVSTMLHEFLYNGWR